jgi:hypothetical protein
MNTVSTIMQGSWRSYKHRGTEKWRAILHKQEKNGDGEKNSRKKTPYKVSEGAYLPPTRVNRSKYATTSRAKAKLSCCLPPTEKPWRSRTVATIVGFLGFVGVLKTPLPFTNMQYCRTVVQQQFPYKYSKYHALAAVAGTSTCTSTGCTSIVTSTSPTFQRLSELFCVHVLHTSTADSFDVVWDTGASLSISPYLSDFTATPKPSTTRTVLKGIAKGLRIEGSGDVAWKLR